MIDSHAHVAAKQFDADRDEVIARANNAGVLAWIEVGTNVAESKRALDFPHASVGVHPNEIEELREHDWQELKILLAHKNVCAVGEVGLDFSRDGTLSVQEVALKKFIALGQQNNLPIIFHVRNRSVGKTLGVNGKTPSVEETDAHAELIRILREYSDFERPKGVIHTFSGTLAQAQEYITLNMMISFSGVITFKNTGKLPEVARQIPLDRILVETDCPFLSPEPYRGKRNEMAYVKYVVEKIAELREISIEMVAKATEENTRKLFALDS